MKTPAQLRSEIRDLKSKNRILETLTQVNAKAFKVLEDSAFQTKTLLEGRAAKHAEESASRFKIIYEERIAHNKALQVAKYERRILLLILIVLTVGVLTLGFST